MKASFLIGYFGAEGKDEWIASQSEPYVLIEHKTVMRMVAKDLGISMNELFDKFYEKTYDKVFTLIEEAVKENKNIIFDMFLIEESNRSRFLQKLPKYYETEAIVFQVEKEKLEQEMQNLAAELKWNTDKVISVENYRRHVEFSDSEFDVIVNKDLPLIRETNSRQL